MAELPRQSDGERWIRCTLADCTGCKTLTATCGSPLYVWPPSEASRECEVELTEQPAGVRFYMLADSFSDALEDLNRLEFVELNTRGAGLNDGRRMAVHHSRIIGLYDPDWELLPEGRPPGDGGP